MIKQWRNDVQPGLESAAPQAWHTRLQHRARYDPAAWPGYSCIR